MNGLFVHWHRGRGCCRSLNALLSLLSDLPGDNGLIKMPFHAETSETWWRHQMETFTDHLCWESIVTGKFTTQRPVTWRFDVFFDLRLNKRLTEQSWGWWFDTLSRPLWRHCNDIVLTQLLPKFRNPFEILQSVHEIVTKWPITLCEIIQTWHSSYN